jgi:hypothetical protein
MRQAPRNPKHHVTGTLRLLAAPSHDDGDYLHHVDKHHGSSTAWTSTAVTTAAPHEHGGHVLVRAPRTAQWTAGSLRR